MQIIQLQRKDISEFREKDTEASCLAVVVFLCALMNTSRILNFGR
jgi:hypothetical protein